LAGVLGGLFAALPQPMPAPAMAANSSRPSSVFNLRLRPGTLKKNNAARTTLPPTWKVRRNGSWSAALDAAVVLMVSVAVTGAVPEIDAAGDTEQVGISTVPAGLPVTAQVRATVPMKPPLGVMVIAEVPVAPGDAMLTEVLLSVKLGAGPDTGEVTVTSTYVPAIEPPFGVGIGMPNI
jgi:hypothetical protein